MRTVCVLAFVLACASASFAQTAPSPVELRWLDQPPPSSAQGVSWGVPWPRGAIAKDAHFRVTDAQGKNLPVQNWPMAYWPDGSLKWTGHAIAADAHLAGPFTIAPGEPAAPPLSLKINQNDDAIDIANGSTIWRLSKHGTALIDSVEIAKNTVAKNGKLLCILEDRSDYEKQHTTREQNFSSDIESVALEQSGPLRAVVKIQGKHKSDSSDRAWLPFTVRLYFFAGVDSVHVVHSIIFDGDQEKDFIRGLGIRFDVPMRQEFHNRHVRIVGQRTGVFAEPIRVIAGRRNPSRDLYRQQIAGQQLPSIDQLPNRENIEEMAVWDSYKLTQISADSFAIQKRTNPKSAWINAAGGNRSLGMAFIGDTTGGFAVGLKNFWQLAPTELQIDNASTDSAALTLWLWSPDSPAMDLRHYDVKAHGLDASYEDIESGFSTATGVARTHELTLCPFKQVPTNDELLKLAETTAQTPRLVCAPQYYHSIPVFGVWSLPARSSPARKSIEDQLDRGIAFYQGQIEQRRWYGFWDFGDVMHSYDSTRHEWRYDVGGFAWANTELMPDLWLWYSFLRSGRADVFRMAEAMTRHTQEVDVYHIGRFAGLGSRHNVRHWGDGAKELRISQALLKRPYYYLTTDERTGDLMNEVIDADAKLVDVDPLRKIEPKTKYPTHARIGPDWFAACSNLFAAWERTGDTKYRDKIVTGMKSIAAMPHKFFSGDSCGYDPATGTLYQIHDEVAIPHLAALMGGPELCLEITPLIDLPQWSDAWLNYCRYLQAPAEEQKKGIGGTVSTGRGPHFSRMTAYAAMAMKDRKLAERAWQEFFRSDFGNARERFVSQRIEGPDVPVPVDEVPFVSTNDTAQWSLNAIELLELVGDALPEQAPATKSAATDPLHWPEATTQAKPWSRWWWLGSGVDKQNITRLLEQYHEAGIGGLEICPIYGAKGFEERDIDFLSPKWMEMLAHTTSEAQRLGMAIDLTTGTGWPFGGPSVSSADASAKIVLKTYDVAGSSSFSQKLPDGSLQCLRAISEQGQQIDLTSQVQNGHVDWTAPSGKWRLYAVSQVSPIQKVKRAAPGGAGNVLDPYSVAAMDTYLAAFDKAFAHFSAPAPRSEFHDSFEYYGANWSPSFFQEFQRRRGYDLREHLPALYGDGPSDTVARVKCDYRETISDLHLAYIRRWTDWSHRHGSLSRNQAHGAPGNLIDLYAAADIPETEIFGNIDEQNIPMHKLSSSAAHLTGRNLSSSESFTWLGEHFQVSLADVKPAADFLFLGGVNHILFHGIPYSPKDAPWPGWLFYAAVNFGPNGGLWHDLPAFNAYVTRCQSVLQSGKSDNDVLLYWPVHDSWQSSDGLLVPFTVHDQSKWLWPTSFYAVAMKLWNRGYTFDEVSDALLAGAKCMGGRVEIGGSSYRAIVVPKCRLMPVETMRKLTDLARAGATIIVQQALSQDVPGLADLEKRRAEFAALDKSPLRVAAAVEAGLEEARVAREPMVDAGLRFVRRANDRGHDYFIVNRAEKAVDGWISLGTPFESALILDPRFADCAGVAAVRNGEIYLQLQPGESCIVRSFSGAVDAPKWPYRHEAGDPQTITGTWQVHFLDGGPALPGDFRTNELASWTNRDDAEAKRFAGTARYTIEFDLAERAGVQDWLLDLGRVCESARVTINGKEIATVWSKPFELRVGQFLKPGRNSLAIDVTNLAANRIADLDRRGVNWKSFHEINFVNKNYKPFDASNWPPRDSGLLGPVRLIPLAEYDPAHGPG